MPSVKPQIPVRAEREQIDRWKAAAGGSFNSWAVRTLDAEAEAHPVVAPAQYVAPAPSVVSVADVQVADPAKAVAPPRFKQRRQPLKQPRHGVCSRERFHRPEAFCKECGNAP